MSFRLPLTAEKVYLRAGLHTHTFALPGLIRPARPWDRLVQFGFVAYWPKSISWLRLFGTADDGVSGPNIPLRDTLAGLEGVCNAQATRREQAFPTRLLESNSFLACSLPQSNRVFLTAEIDTDHEEFRKAVRDRRNPDKGELVQLIRVLFFDSKQFSNYVQQEGQIDLVLKPCAPVPKFSGVLAIDLGNTCTTATAMSESDPVYRSSSVKLVPLNTDAELGGEPSPLPSIIRLDRITSKVDVPEGMRRFPSLPGDDRPTAVAYVVGDLAAAGSADGELPSGTVFGAKQLLTVKPAPQDSNGRAEEEREPSFSLVVTHTRSDGASQSEAVEVLNRLPGELLFTHTVRQFRRAACHWPDDLVLTYPTTYSPRELLQLTRAAVRGWLRAMGQPQDFSADYEPNESPQLEELGNFARNWLHTPSEPCRLIGLTIDEATSASFFYIYRKVFEQPGGLVRFRYLYPDGLRLLLIDCGGGTTDVALVHAISRQEKPSLLEIDVLARTGLRGFGGDHITREVCRLVKAKLLLLLFRGRNLSGMPSPLPAAGPTNAKQAAELVNAFLAKINQLNAGDELVPTKFDPRLSDAATLQRKTCFQSLWQLGEALKFELARGRPVKLRELNPALIGKDTSALIASVVRSLPAPAQVQILSQIGELTFAPWEIDTLVRDRVEEVMAKCNRLISKHLTGGYGGEREVDWVVVSGNGARYPLVRQLAEQKLEVATIEERITLDTDNLKNAVAKGAAMARMVERVPRTLGIHFNRHLSDLLPFDVAYHDMVTNESKLLFEEYTSYSELAKVPRPVTLILPEGSTSGLGNTFILERRFPGDNSFEQYAAYRFPSGISGELEVRYDPGTGEFRVRDSKTGDEGEVRDLTEQDHLPTAMRGDI